MKKIFWAISILLLVFLIFQPLLKSRYDILSYIDELFIVLCLLALVLILLLTGRIKKSAFGILGIMALFCAEGLLSGAINGNKIIITVNGVFDYIKNFLPIPFFAMLKFSTGRVKKMYKILLLVAIIFCLVGIIQEIMFFCGCKFEGDVRFGILRVRPLEHHPNVYGLCCLFFLIMEYSLYKRVRWYGFLLIVGIMLSVSRMVWISFVFASVLLILRQKIGRMLPLVVFMLIVLFFALPAFFRYTKSETIPTATFRGYALHKSIEIWRDHYFFGTGPGMYGGVVSVKYNSPVYEKYNFDSEQYNYWVKKIRSLDQFWSQILAETGIIGTVIFLWLLLYLFKIPYRHALALRNNEFTTNMLKGLSLIPIVIIVYLVGSGLNLNLFLLTYSILLGACLGVRNENTSS